MPRTERCTHGCGEPAEAPLYDVAAFLRAELRERRRRRALRWGTLLVAVGLAGAVRGVWRWLTS